MRFVVADPLLRFWFRFVFPNTSYLAQMGGERAFRDRIRPGLDAYFGGCFELLCRDALSRLYAGERVSAAFEVGEYWDKTTQLDVVGIRDDGVIDLGECKWGHVRSPVALARELREKVQRFPNRRDATIQLRVFTRAAVTHARVPPDGADIRWHSLADLYA